MVPSHAYQAIPLIRRISRLLLKQFWDPSAGLTRAHTACSESRDLPEHLVENGRTLPNTIKLRLAIFRPEAQRVADAEEPVREIAKVLVDPMPCADEGSPIAGILPGRYVRDVGEAQPCEAVLAGAVGDLGLVAGIFDGFGVVG